MSTQQQIQAWQQAIDQKQQEKADQETILKVEQEQLAKAETARIDAELALDRARKSGASVEQVESLQRQARLADSAESDARIAAGKTQRNIEALDGSIRFNTSNRDQFQSSLPNQANGASTVGDQAANARADAAEVAPAPTPAANAPDPVPRSAIEEGGDVEAQEALAVRNAAAEPVQDFVRDPVTGEQVPSDSVQAEQILAEQNRVQSDAPDPVDDPFEAARLAREAEFDEEQPAVFGPEPVAGSTDSGLQDPAQRAQQAVQNAPLSPEEQEAKEQAAAKANAINQATRQSVYKQGGSTDWRVRLQLSPTSNYLYNAKQPGILGSLFATNGVIFPYTPQIQTTYRANYTNYDLVHSNFRGVFYQSSKVDDINLKATFTAQDSNEANYLLAVIHFFRSVTKMFYGKDPQRGTPPPLVYLSGLGMNQFYGHPCLVSAFTYSLPDNVDYIRASTLNNYGTDLLNRLRPASSPSSTSGLGPTGNRILNSPQLRDFLGLNSRPAPNPGIGYSLNNTQLSNYVPTKMEIDIVLIPVQTRSQVSKQFSLENFANGNLIKNGFW